MRADFSGYATKAGLKCSDGRTIMPHAFKEQHGVKVPLVWQHGHNNPNNVLGHAILENREDGVYAYGYFNDTATGKSARVLVQHGDIVSLSIYANKLVEKAKQVFHGTIREVSLVLSGANPGALIDNVTLSHSDGTVEALEDEAVIYTGLVLEHEDLDEDKVADPESENTEESDDAKTETEETSESSDEVEHQDGDQSVRDVYDSFTEEQKLVVNFIVGAALETAAATHSDSDEESLEHTEGSDNMGRNVFEQRDASTDEKSSTASLSHSDIQEIVADAQRVGSLKEAVEAYALKHGIDNIEVLFPDAKTIADRPEWDKRRTEWVAGVLSGTRHTPFSRIKTMSADITMDEARARGYIKGNMKKEEFFSVAKRVTTPTTIYKKQKLDRDDIIDITDFDVVAWVKAEMRMMLEEELARAILIGDGREVDDEDKINESNIRPILNEHELYRTDINVNLGDTSSSPIEIVDAVLSARQFFKGTGTPTFYTTEAVLTKLLLVRDQFGRRMYRTDAELAAEMRVSNIVTVEVMESVPGLLGIIVNLQDYVVGADRGGEVSMFDDFDIDYNQYKYLIETRVSGALTKLKSAMVVWDVNDNDPGTVIPAPKAPTYNKETNVVNIPSGANYAYYDEELGTEITGPTLSVGAGETVVLVAKADTGFFFENTARTRWAFTNRA